MKVFGDFSLDDAGFFDVDGLKVVASTDGIIEDIVKFNPYMAGVYSVIVNVNDVVARGAMPVGFMYVISSKIKENRLNMAEGVKAGIDLYGLKLLKAHTHPDHSYESIDAAVIGIAKKIISSRKAKVDDEILVAIDLAGSPKTEKWIKCFDSVMDSPKNEVLNKLSSMSIIAEKRLANASRDISTPGIVGSLSMMCESSGVGVLCDLEKIPRPNTVDLMDWLTVYPSIGFIVTSENAETCCEIFEERNLTVGRIGVVTANKQVVLTLNGQKGVFIDLREESMFGL